MLVRIHPVNRGQGYVRERHIHGPYDFRVEKGWYEVDYETSQFLKTVTNHGNGFSQPVFIVATHEQARAMEELEADEYAKAAAPVPLPAAAKTKDSSPEKEDAKDSLTPEQSRKAVEEFLEAEAAKTLEELEAELEADEEAEAAPQRAPKKKLPSSIGTKKKPIRRRKKKATAKS